MALRKCIFSFAICFQPKKYVVAVKHSLLYFYRSVSGPSEFCALLDICCFCVVEETMVRRRYIARHNTVTRDTVDVLLKVCITIWQKTAS